MNRSAVDDVSGLAVDRLAWDCPQPRGSGLDEDPDSWARRTASEGGGAACMLGLALLWLAFACGVAVGWALRGAWQ